MKRPFFEPKALKAINLGWDHGRWGDYWSLMHFLTGIIIGGLGLLLGFSLPETFFGSIIFAALYECAEIAFKISEDVQNALGDMALTAIGVPIVFYIFPMLGLTVNNLLLILCALFLMNTFLFLRGWDGYLRDRIRKNKRS